MLCAGLFVQAHGQAEQHTGQLGVIVVGDGVAGEEGVDAELLRAFLQQAGIRFGHLVLGHAVFGIAGVVHDAVAKLKHAAGVVAAADDGRDARDPLKEIDMGQIVQVDDGLQVPGFAHVLGRGLVGGEHDIAAVEITRLAELQLGIARAVDAAALLLQDLEQVGVGGGFDGEIFFVAGVPGERLLYAAGVFTDGFFVIDMERGGHIGDDGLRLFQRDKRLFFVGHGVRHPFLALRPAGASLYAAAGRV